MPTIARSCLVLFALLLVGSCGEGEPSAASWERGVALKGQPNFRDLGGYRTADGRVVKRGILFRSGTLSRLTDEDVAALEFLGVKSVVNFLTDGEIRARGADRLPPGVRLVHLPLDGGDGLAAVVLEARKTGDFSKVPVDLNPEIHRLLIREAREEYAALIRTVADSEQQPVVFHCSHGVHRTGTAAAIVLSALGVPWETVRRDYLLSNEHRKDEIEKRMAQLRKLAADSQHVQPDEVDDSNIRAFYLLDGKYIDASLEEAVEEFGSMENYIRSGLGISDEELQRLRAALLE